MNIVFRKLYRVYIILLSYIYKLSIDLGIRGIKSLKTKTRDCKIIVSLTSYGRRVSDNVVFYTIVSLLNQSEQPDKIVLWLDNDNWNIENLPPKIASLTNKGLEIRFCNDWKSYKKLIPSLLNYPEDIIITVDDDIIYPHDFVEVFIKYHAIYPKHILCGRGKIMTKNSDGVIRKYKDWKSAMPYQSTDPIIPIGLEGVLYPPNSLHKDVIRDDIFMSLSPSADDLWFWAMAMLNRTEHMVIKPKNAYLSFDSLYQFLHKGSALTHSNASIGNDKQLNNIIKYYSIEL